MISTIAFIKYIYVLYIYACYSVATKIDTDNYLDYIKLLAVLISGVLLL